MGERVTSLFSGIGGFEAGFRGSGLTPVLMCEIDPAAAAVLKARFPGIDLKTDIRRLKDLPECEVLVAGWPCQDLSQAGRTAGITGEQSGLVDEIFRLLDATSQKPETIVLENVAFALSLHKGAAIRHVTEALQERGYRWAYRVLDTLEFGLPQRRRRLFVCASLNRDPATVLFDGITLVSPSHALPTEVGFYWTEGNSGIGWTPNAIPPLKGGSSLSIPSPPAIWHKEMGLFSVPSLEDAERLQGFNGGWTSPATDVGGTDRVRWRLVGNAVSVPVARWLSERLLGADDEHTTQLPSALNSAAGHTAATGGPSEVPRYFRGTHEGPSVSSRRTIADFGLSKGKPLSQRAACGFLARYSKSKLAVKPEFQRALQTYCAPSLQK